MYLSNTHHFGLVFNYIAIREKRETVIAPINKGGLKMPEVFAFQEAQKISFIKNLLVEDSKCLNLFLKVCGLKKFMLTTNHHMMTSVTV